MTELPPDDVVLIGDTQFTRFETGGAHADPQQPADPEEKIHDSNQDLGRLQTNTPAENVPTYPDGKLPGQEHVETLPVSGEQRGETPIVTDDQ